MQADLAYQPHMMGGTKGMKQRDLPLCAIYKMRFGVGKGVFQVDELQV